MSERDRNDRPEPDLPPLPGFAQYDLSGVDLDDAPPPPPRPARGRRRRAAERAEEIDDRLDDGDDVGARFTDRDGDGVDDRLEAAIERRRAAAGRIGGRYEHVLSSDEQLLMRTRTHPFAVAGRIAGPLVFGLLALVGAIILGGFLPEAEGAIFAAGLLCFVLAGSGSAWAYLSWKREEFLVTDRRIVRVSGVLNLTLAETALEKINDMREQRSFWGRLFGYGDLEILTAADSPAAVDRYLSIAHPVEFRMTINEAKRRFGADEWRR